MNKLPKECTNSVRDMVFKVDEREARIFATTPRLERLVMDSTCDDWIRLAKNIARMKSERGYNLRELVNLGFKDVEEARAWLAKGDK